MTEKPDDAAYARAKALIIALKEAGFVGGGLPEAEYLMLWDIALKHTSSAGRTALSLHQGEQTGWTAER
jgi:hypothetical protein